MSFRYRPMLAIGIDGEVVRSGSGQVYAISDTSYTTPLAVTDLLGITMAGNLIQIDSLGLTAAFNCANGEVNWKSGSLIVPIDSNQGLVDAATAAAQAAADSADAAAISAQAALDAAAAATPSDAATAALVEDTLSLTRQALDAAFAAAGATDPNALHLADTATLTGVVTFGQPPVLPVDAVPISRVATLQTELNLKATNVALATKAAFAVGSGMVTSNRTVVVASIGDYPASVPGGGLPGDVVMVLVA